MQGVSSGAGSTAVAASSAIPNENNLGATGQVSSETCHVGPLIRPSLEVTRYRNRRTWTVH